MLPDPYRRLGLAGNPFVADEGGDVGAALFVDPGLLPPRDGEIVELVGPRGSGKTTLLHRWLEQLGGGAYDRVPPGPTRLRSLPTGPVVALDEVDRLPRRRLRRTVERARRSGATLLLGTHVPGGLADRSEQLPPPTAGRIAEFSRRRIAAAALPDGSCDPLLQPSAAHIDEVLARADGCWWTIGTLLHARAAGLACGEADRSAAWGRMQVVS